MARIVIADDSPTLRRIVTSVLTKEGHEVVAAEDGIGAVQAVLLHQPDAVVLDVQMPRVSGFIAARLLKDDWQTADIPVVMLTAFSQRDLIEQARDAGDRLVIGLNSDDSVRRLKGPTRPVNTQADRAAVLAALASVDAVVVFTQAWCREKARPR